MLNTNFFIKGIEHHPLEQGDSVPNFILQDDKGQPVTIDTQKQTLLVFGVYYNDIAAKEYYSKVVPVVNKLKALNPVLINASASKFNQTLRETYGVEVQILSDNAGFKVTRSLTGNDSQGFAVAVLIEGGQITKKIVGLVFQPDEFVQELEALAPAPAKATKPAKTEVEAK